MEISTLAKRFCEHSSYIRGYSSATIFRYQNGIKRFLDYTKLSQIEDVNENITKEYFYYGRTERKWSTHSFITYHKTLAVFFRWCVEQKFMASNPVDDMELPKLNKRLPPKLTRQDALKLLEVVYNYPYQYKFLRARNHAIFSMFIFTGIRRKELLSLRYSDVDLENRSLFVNQGKGGKDRIIPLCSTLVESLIRYLDERKRLKKTCPEFFASFNRDSGFTDSGMKRLVEHFIIASKLKFNVHKLRHTFATLMLEGGCDIYSLSKMMGHSDIKTTTIYLAASAEHLRGQIMKHPLNEI